MQQRDLGLLATGAAIAAALFALYQWRAGSTPDPQPTPVTAAATPVPGTTGATMAPAVPSVADSTAKLAARLQKSGGSAADWQLLGKSYDFLGMKPEADAAYARGGGRPASSAVVGPGADAGAPVAASPAPKG